MKKCIKCNSLESIKNSEVYKIFQKSKDTMEKESRIKRKDSTPYNAMSTDHLEACRDYARSSIAIAEMVNKLLKNG